MEKQRRISQLQREVSIGKAKQQIYEREDHDVQPDQFNMNLTYTCNPDLKRMEQEVPSNTLGDHGPALQKSGIVDIGMERTPRNTNISDLCAAISQMMQIQNTPKVELDSFDGNPLDYHYFKASFVDVVESSITDQHGRLTRLIQYISGEAKDLVKGFIHERNTDCYTKALQALDKEYGNVHRISSAFMNQLKQWPIIKGNDTKGSKALYRFLMKCNVLKDGGKLNALDSPENIRLVLSKFGTYIQDGWNRNALKIERKKLRESDFKDLITFLDIQINLMSHPDYSREAYQEHKDKRTSALALRTYASQVNNDEMDERRRSVSCFCCKDQHVLEECETFERMAVEDTVKFLSEQHLCYGCFRPTNKQHYARICRRKMTCSICNASHPTLLHEHFYKSISVARVEAKFNGVISLCVVPVVLAHQRYPEIRISLYAMLDECSQGTYIDDSILEHLPSCLFKDATITLQTLNGYDTVNSKVVNTVQCNSFHSSRYATETITLPTTYSQNGLPGCE